MRILLAILLAAFPLLTQAQTLVKPLNGGTGIANANANTLTISSASTVSGTNTGDNAANSIYTIGSQTQAYSAKLGAFSALTDAAGWLHSNGSGTYAWSTPTYTDVGALAAGATAADSSKLGGSLPAAYALVGQTMNIGTTAVAINRASAALVLTGITSIDGSSASTTGNAATATKSTNLIGGNSTTLLGAIPYQSGTDTTAFVVNTTSTKKFLRETGTGTNGAAPAWDTPALGDVSGLGTGIATALAINVGTAGAPVILGGALGTPSSGVGTNITSVNAASLQGNTWASPPTIGNVFTPGIINASTLYANYLNVGVTGTNTGSVSFNGLTSGAAVLTVPDIAGSPTIYLPTVNGTLATLAGTETLTNKTLTSPTFTTPALGTPSSGTLTSATGLPISTGVSGMGTGNATALAVNVGTAGSFNPMTTGGDIIYGGASGVSTRLANGTVGQALLSGGTTVAPVWTTITQMTYPGSGIGNSTGSAWGTSYTTSGTGTVLALAAGPTFTGTATTATVSSILNNNTGVIGFLAQNTNSGSVAYAGLQINDNSGSLAVFNGYNNNTHEMRINNVASSGAINFMLNSVSKFLVSGSGAIAIPGIASSSAGTTGTVCWTTSTGNLTVDTTTTCLLSARRFKKWIKPYADGLAAVLAMKPVSYTLKDDPTHIGEQLGFIAEDVATVDKRLVSYEKNGKTRSVRYQQYTAVLTKALQQMYAIVQQQDARIKVLEALR